MEERITDKEYGYKKCRDCAYRNCQYCDDYAEIKEEEHNRLAKYENLEEQGLIVRLPCKVGTPIFLISNRSLISGKRCLYEGVVEGFVTDGYSTYYNLGLFTENINSGNIFFNRPEAEKKLEELNK